MKLDSRAVIAKGEPVLYSNQEAWVYRPNPKSKKCWLVIGDGEAYPCNWVELWGRESIKPQPDLKYQQELGIQVLELNDSCGEYHTHVQCPFCNTHYVNRFEYRKPISDLCVACQGSGERAMYLEAIIDAYLDQIRRERDIQLAETIGNKLNGYHQFEYRRTIRVLRDLEKDKEHKG
jgi:hypothetical protein